MFRTKRIFAVVFSPGPYKLSDENFDDLRVVETESGFYYDPEVAAMYSNN